MTQNKVGDGVRTIWGQQTLGFTLGYLFVPAGRLLSLFRVSIFFISGRYLSDSCYLVTSVLLQLKYATRLLFLSSKVFAWAFKHMCLDVP